MMLVSSLSKVCRFLSFLVIPHHLQPTASWGGQPPHSQASVSTTTMRPSLALAGRTPQPEVTPAPFSIGLSDDFDAGSIVAVDHSASLPLAPRAVFNAIQYRAYAVSKKHGFHIAAQFCFGRAESCQALPCTLPLEKPGRHRTLRYPGETFHLMAGRRHRQYK